MSAFGLFALILTTAYIIYFAAVIAKDVTASKKSPDADSGSESFDVSSFAQEESVEVKETNDGFAVGDNETTTDAVAAKADESEAEGKQPNSEEKVQQVTERMDNSEEFVDFDVSLPDDKFHECLINDQIRNQTIGTSFMFSRQEVAAGESQKSSVGNVQGRDAV